jgi:ketosteroid isomerase-like protein
MTDSDGSAKEIVELHEAWFAAAAAKDLDASMAPISTDVVSYEHTAPLQLTEVSAIREECRAGFERAADDFAWTVPDLRVLVRDDLAVAWGLNRMADRHPDGTEDVTWSRGTRVFQRSGGRWRMVHQHVSFPVDPATGMAATDLTP